MNPFGWSQGRIAFDLPIAAVDDEKLVNLYRPDDGEERQNWQPASAGISGALP